MELLFIIRSLLLFSLIFPLYLYFCYRTATAQKKSISNGGLINYPLIGCLLGFVKNKHRVLDWISGILATSPTKTAIFLRASVPTQVSTENPSNVKHVLKTHFDHYPQGDRFRSLLHDMLGDGLFIADGDLWKVQRKMAGYEFNSNSLRNFAMDNVTIESRTRLLPLLRNVSWVCQVLDLQEVPRYFAFDNICKMAFNVSRAGQVLDLLLTEGITTSDFTRALNNAASSSICPRGGSTRMENSSRRALAVSWYFMPG